MPFIIIADKARKDPLGPQTLESLRENLYFERGLLDHEHIISTGEHNALEVPRVCRKISGTTVSPSSSDITAVTNPAVGKYVLTLAASRFDTDMRPQLNVQGADGLKPYVAGVQVVSATSLEVYIEKLSSALGAGNTWAAADSDFDIAIHSTPLTTGTWNDLPVQLSRGSPLDDLIASGATWNAFAQESANLNAAVIAEHATTGEHAVRQVASRAGMVRFQGGTTYAADGSTNFSSYTRLSAGVVEVNWTTALTTPLSQFICGDYARQGAGSSSDLFVYNAVPSSTTKVTVYCWKFDPGAKTWSAADGDFYLVVHGS